MSEINFDDNSLILIKPLGLYQRSYNLLLKELKSSDLEISKEKYVWLTENQVLELYPLLRARRNYNKLVSTFTCGPSLALHVTGAGAVLNTHFILGSSGLQEELESHMISLGLDDSESKDRFFAYSEESKDSEHQLNYLFSDSIEDLDISNVYKLNQAQYQETQQVNMIILYTILREEKNVKAIASKITQCGLKIESKTSSLLTKDKLTILFAHIYGESFELPGFDTKIKSVVGNDLSILTISGENAAEKLKFLTGPTIPEDSKFKHSQCIRELYPTVDPFGGIALNIDSNGNLFNLDAVLKAKSKKNKNKNKNRDADADAGASVVVDASKVSTNILVPNITPVLLAQDASVDIQPHHNEPTNVTNISTSLEEYQEGLEKLEITNSVAGKIADKKPLESDSAHDELNTLETEHDLKLHDMSQDARAVEPKSLIEEGDSPTNTRPDLEVAQEVSAIAENDTNVAAGESELTPTDEQKLPSVITEDIDIISKPSAVSSLVSDSVEKSTVSKQVDSALVESITTTDALPTESQSNMSTSDARIPEATLSEDMTGSISSSDHAEPLFKNQKDVPYQEQSLKPNIDDVKEISKNLASVSLTAQETTQQDTDQLSPAKPSTNTDSGRTTPVRSNPGISLNNTTPSRASGQSRVLNSPFVQLDKLISSNSSIENGKEIGISDVVRPQIPSMHGLSGDESSVKKTLKLFNSKENLSREFNSLAGDTTTANATKSADTVSSSNQQNLPLSGTQPAVTDSPPDQVAQDLSSVSVQASETKPEDKVENKVDETQAEQISEPLSDHIFRDVSKANDSSELKPKTEADTTEASKLSIKSQENAINNTQDSAHSNPVANSIRRSPVARTTKATRLTASNTSTLRLNAKESTTLNRTKTPEKLRAREVGVKAEESTRASAEKINTKVSQPLLKKEPTRTLNTHTRATVPKPAEKAITPSKSTSYISSTQQVSANDKIQMPKQSKPSLAFMRPTTSSTTRTALKRTEMTSTSATTGSTTATPSAARAMAKSHQGFAATRTVGVGSASGGHSLSSKASSDVHDSGGKRAPRKAPLPTFARFSATKTKTEPETNDNDRDKAIRARKPPLPTQARGSTAPKNP